MPDSSLDSRSSFDPASTSVDAAFVAAFRSGGDARTAIDPVTGRDSYFCPGLPDPSLACLSSCTASPPSVVGWAEAREAFVKLSLAPQPDVAFSALRGFVSDAIVEWFGVSELATAIPCPSGTDALRLGVEAISAHRGLVAPSFVLPTAAETGSGVPAAVASAVLGSRVVEVPIRDRAGRRMAPAPLRRRFLDAARDDQVLVLTYPTKTGLSVPADAPNSSPCVVDACQGRIHPSEIAKHVSRGRPVAVTGSKFLGGPPFSGALLLPAGMPVPQLPEADHYGPLLRWVAALSVVPMISKAERRSWSRRILRNRLADVARSAAVRPALRFVLPPPAGGAGWQSLPSILPFFVTPPGATEPLGMDAARQLHRALAVEGVLLGQPVLVGGRGALRIAFGASDLADDDRGVSVRRAFAAIDDVLPRFSGGAAANS